MTQLNVIEGIVQLLLLDIDTQGLRYRRLLEVLHLRTLVNEVRSGQHYTIEVVRPKVTAEPLLTATGKPRSQ